MDARKEQQRTANTKRAILKSALVEFADYGFTGASLRRIGEAAEQNHRLIGHHFGSKLDLWKETARYVFKEYEQRLDEKLTDIEALDEVQSVELMMRVFIIYSAENPSLNRFMLQANYATEQMSWLVDELIAPSKYGYLSWIEAAQEKGFFVKGNPKKLHYLFVGAATSIFMFCEEYKLVLKEDPFDSAAIEEHITLILSIFIPQTE